MNLNQNKTKRHCYYHEEDYTPPTTLNETHQAPLHQKFTGNKIVDM